MVALLVFGSLLGFALVCVTISATISALVRRRQAKRLQNAKRKLLIHSINDDRCTGCDACVSVCPTDVLELDNNKSKVVALLRLHPVRAVRQRLPDDRAGHALRRHQGAADPHAAARRLLPGAPRASTSSAKPRASRW